MDSPIARERDELRREIKDYSRIAEAEIKHNPVGTIRRRFEAMHALREPYLNEAKTMAELVMPGMYEGTPTEPCAGTTQFGTDNFVSANQSLIAKGVMLLSWTMATTILPPDGDYLSRHIEHSIAAQLEQMDMLRQAESQAMGAGGDPEDFVPIHIQINQELLRDDSIVRKHTASSNHQEVLARCLYHSLISGISVFGHLTLDEAKAYTIQNSITKFDSAHEPVEVIVVDRMPLVALSEGVRRQLVGNLDGEELSRLEGDEQFVTIYTQQIRVSPDTLAINTEIEGIPIDELSFEVPADAPVLIPMPFMFLNEVDPYPIGWLTYNRGDCNSYENGELSIEGMVEAAAACIMGIPPGARLTSDELRDGGPGVHVVAIGDAKARIEAIVAPISQNLQQVAARQEKKERQLMMTFGMDFAIQRPGERVTAEEIQMMARGLQKLFGATYKQLERAWQQRHARRQFYLAEEAKLIRPIDKSWYVLSVTAGLQAMEAQNEIAKMDNLVQRAAAFGPEAITRFGIDPTLHWYATKLKLDVSDKLLTPEQQAEQLGVGQLLAIVRQLGPQAPGMLAQLLMQLTNGGNPNESTTSSATGGPPQIPGG